MRKRKNKLLSLFKNLFILVFCFFILGLFLFFYYTKDLPRPEIFGERELYQSTKIYDRTGNVLLYEIYGEEKRTPVPLATIPDFLKKAVIAVEDSNFYHHFGLDFRGIARSILMNFKIMKPVYGGSTIPQQLIRSTFFTNEKTASRKIREIILTLELDRRYSKDQILEWYLNQVPFGSNSYGVEAASQTYFKKPVSEISLAQAATLAAIIQSPTYLSPYGSHKDELLARKDYVLNRMIKEGYISQDQAQEAKKEELVFAKVLQPIKAPHFVFYVKDFLIEKYGESFLREKGFKVYTSLDWGMQKEAETIVEEKIELNKIYNAFNGAMVAIDPKTGQILAMVGSKNWFADPYPENCTPGKDCLFEPQPNVTIRNRQPGSAFKPFVYATAFGKGYDDKTIVVDEPTNFGVWGGKEYSPQNYDGLFRGPVTLREALAQSLNVPSVKVLLNLAGLEDSIKTAQNLGITTLNPPFGPSIVLGGWEVKLLEMTSAYGVFANDGLRIPSVSILKIEDKDGNEIFKNESSPKRVLESKVVRLINDILSDNEARTPIFGSRSNLYVEGYQVAAKTGTTQDYKDGWAIGYTPSIVVGAWVGNNNSKEMKQRPAVVLAGSIFNEFIRKALAKYPKESFLKND